MGLTTKVVLIVAVVGLLVGFVVVAGAVLDVQFKTGSLQSDLSVLRHQQQALVVRKQDLDAVQLQLEDQISVLQAERRQEELGRLAEEERLAQLRKAEEQARLKRAAQLARERELQALRDAQKKRVTRAS